MVVRTAPALRCRFPSLRTPKSGSGGLIWRRYGGFVDYVRDVRAWDGQSFQWILRLDGGGVGVRLDGRQVRIGVQAGTEWKAHSTCCCARPKPAFGSRSLTCRVWRFASKRLFTCCWLRKKALPARGSCGS